MIVAGFATTASTMAFAVYLLARNPDKLRKFLAEIDAAGKERPSYDDLLEKVRGARLFCNALSPADEGAMGHAGTVREMTYTCTSAGHVTHCLPTAYDGLHGFCS
jgi:cytochrome P450